MERELRVLGLDLGTNSVGHALIVKKYRDDEALQNVITAKFLTR